MIMPFIKTNKSIPESVISRWHLISLIELKASGDSFQIYSHWTLSLLIQFFNSCNIIDLSFLSKYNKVTMNINL